MKGSFTFDGDLSRGNHVSLTRIFANPATVARLFTFIFLRNLLHHQRLSLGERQNRRLDLHFCGLGNHSFLLRLVFIDLLLLPLLYLLLDHLIDHDRD